MFGVDKRADQQRLPADAFLVCGGHVWPVHRLFLTERSPVFSAYFKDVSKVGQLTSEGDVWLT